ncbi:hypothetical protein H4R33_006867, partial [Dimargaris cristalligena]
TDKHALAARIAELTSMNNTRTITAPQNSGQVLVVEALSQTLGVPSVEIDIHDSFFQLGGDSISAIRLSSLCRDRGLYISIAQVFKCSNIIELAECAADNSKSDWQSETHRSTHYEPYSLLGEVSNSSAARDSLLQEAASRLQLGLSEITDILPVSGLQLGFLVSTLKDPSSYMVQESFTISGDLDVSRLQEAWHQLAGHHDILRAKFFQPGSLSTHSFLQVITKRCDIEWTINTNIVDDWSTLEKTYFAGDRQRGFTFDGPLLRISLFISPATSNSRHLCFFTFHHGLLDAWSHNIILAQLVDLYHGTELTPSPQFSHYISHLQCTNNSQYQLFWQTHLGNARPTPPIHFPVFLPEPLVCGYGTYRSTLSSSLSSLHAFCRQQSITLNTLLRGVWALTLSRYLSESDEVSFGVLTSGRNVSVPGIQNMVGMCINALPFRVILDLSASVTNFVQCLHRQSGDLTTFEQCGLLDIYKWGEINLETKLFNSLMVYDNFPSSTPKTTNSDIIFELRDGQNFTEYAYAISFLDNGDNLDCHLVYDIAHCDDSYAIYLMWFINHCLTMMVNDPHLSLSELMTLPTDEAQLVEKWAQGPVHEFPQRHWLAYQLFTQHLATQPNAIALETSSRHFTYAEVYHRSGCIALTLQQRGFKPGNFAAMIFNNSVDFIFSYLGVLLAGGVCVPMDATNATDRLQYSFDLLDDPWSLTTTEYFERFKGYIRELESQCFLVDTIDPHGMVTDLFQPDTTRAPWDLAYIVFTSGTTGRPKGIPARHESLVNFIISSCETTQLDSECRFLQLLNISFDGCLFEILGTFHSGGTLVLMDGNFADTLTRVNTCIITPSLLATIDPSGYPNIAKVITAGEALPTSVGHQWCKHVSLYNFYGPTEITIGCHANLVQINEPISIGYPIANTHGYILDDQLQPVPIGVPGELCIGGVGVGSGYWKQPELTAKSFVPNPFGPGGLYRSGDLVCQLSSGKVLFISRKDFQVKLRGYRIELGEIENTASSIEGVINAVACVTQQQLVLYIAPTSVDTVALEIQLTSKLPRYMVPNFIVILDCIPMTSVGKADRKTLQARPLPVTNYGDEAISGYLSNTFQVARNLLAKVLGIDSARVAPSASFLRLGGDSISAIHFSSVCREHGWQLSISQILQSRSVSDLFHLLEEQVLNSTTDPISPYEPFSLAKSVVSTAGFLTLRHEAASLLNITSENIVDIYPVSSLQLGFLINTLKDPSAYMVQQSFAIHGQLDLNRFHRVWMEVAQNHPILRTKFIQTDSVEGIPFLQVVTSDNDVEWSTHVGSSQEADEAQVAKGYFALDRQRGFDLHGPLLRIHTHSFKPDYHICFLAFHHALLDAWSVNVILNELVGQYHGVPTSPSTPFAAYIEHLQKIDQTDCQTFWASALENTKPTPAIRFPVYHPESPPYDYGTRRFTLSVDLPTLHQFCHDQLVTLNSLLRCLWAITLAHYLSETHEVTFGGLASGRNVPVAGIQDMVGMCINTLPIRVSLALNQTVAQFIQMVNRQSIDVTTYEQCSLLDIYKWGKVDPEVRLFDSIMMYENFPSTISPVTTPEISFNLSDGQNFTEYAYALSFFDNDTSLDGSLMYSHTHCDGNFAGFLIQFVDHCLTTMVKDPSATLHELMSLPANESRLIQKWAQGHVREFPQRQWLAHRLFTQHISSRSNHIALETTSQQFTYAEMYHHSCCFALALQQAGFRPGNHAALLLPRSAEFIFSYFGALLAGGVCVPLDVANATDRLLYILHQLDNPWLVTSTVHQMEPAADLRVADSRTLFVDDILIDEVDTSEFQPDSSRSPSDDMYILFTSGTTGRPKG